MELAEQIQVRWTPELAALCHAAKNLYNLGNFYVRQFYFNLGECVNYYDLQFMLRNCAGYKALPAQTSQQVLRLVFQNWRAYFAVLSEYKVDPGKFRARPRPPGYKAKDGECVAIFTNQNTRVKGSFIHFPKSCHLPPLKVRVLHYQQVRVVPHGIYYTIEIVYLLVEEDLHLDKERAVGIDLGLNNLVTMVNNAGLAPCIVKGGVAKSANQ